MSYKIVKSPKAWWDVIFPGVTEDGSVVENSFRMRFKLLDEDELATVETDVRSLVDGDGVDGMQGTALSTDVILRLAEDWQGVTMEDDNGVETSLPFSKENVLKMVRVPNAFSGMIAAYRSCRRAEPAKRLGN